MMTILDLQAERCPNAMSLVRLSLTRAVQSGFEGTLQIRTLEPSLESKIEIFAELSSLPCTLVNSQSVSLSQERRAELLETEDIDNKELAYFSSEQFITVTINGVHHA
ncbi:hypothetical protein ACP3V5_17240 [Vibrio maritimus]